MPPVLALSCGRLTPPLSPSATARRTGAFAGEFGDAFIKDTELEGGHTAPALRLVIDILKEMMGGTNAGPWRRRADVLYNCVGGMDVGQRKAVKGRRGRWVE